MATTTGPAADANPEVVVLGTSGGGGGRGPGGPYRPTHAAWRPPLGPGRRFIREIGFDLITAGIVVLLFVGYQLWGTGLAEASSQNKLKQQFNAPATTASPGGDSATVGPTPPTQVQPGAPTGAAIAHMVIPKIGVDKYVVEGISEAALREGPGHYPGTPMPGEPGNSAIAGHRTTYGAPFYDLDALQPGDEIFLTTKAGQFHYTVDSSQIVKPSEVGVVGPTKDNRLTLTTCNPRFSATTRLIVVAKLTNLPVTPPSTAAVAVPAPLAVINLGSGNSSAWPPSILYGLTAGGLWVGFRVWGSRRRRRRWLPVLLGIPVCLIPLWFVFENVIRLLPNNI